MNHILQEITNHILPEITNHILPEITNHILPELQYHHSLQKRSKKDVRKTETYRKSGKRL